MAQRYIASFFDDYPTSEDERVAHPHELIKRYFRARKMHCRACWVVNLVKAFLNDPPVPIIPRYQTGTFDSHLRAVARLPGVGEYASNAWRLFCREAFEAAAVERTVAQSTSG